MNSQKVTNSMTCSMHVILVSLPKMPSCQNIHIGTWHFGSLWPFDSFNVQIAQKHSGIRVFFLWSGLSKMESSRNISRAIQVLSSRIYQMNHVIGNVRVVSLSWRVMNHGSIRTSWTDCIKAQASVVLKLESSGVNVLSSLEFVYFLLFGSPCPELNLCNCVSDVTIPESVDLFVCSHCSLKTNSFPFDWFFKARVNVMIKWIFHNQCLLWEFRFIFCELNASFAQMVDDGLIALWGMIFWKV